MHLFIRILISTSLMVGAISAQAQSASRVDQIKNHLEFLSLKLRAVTAADFKTSSREQQCMQISMWRARYLMLTKELRDEPRIASAISASMTDVIQGFSIVDQYCASNSVSYETLANGMAQVSMGSYLSRQAIK